MTTFPSISILSGNTSGNRLVPLAIIGILGLTGILLVYNVTRYDRECMLFLRHQAVSLVLSLGLSAAILYAPAQLLSRLFRPAAIIGYASLLGLFLFGSRINGSCSWYRLASRTIQPGELLKPLYIAALSFLACFSGERAIRHRHVWLMAAASAFILPLALLPDWGTCLVYTLVLGVILWSDGISRRLLAAGAALFALFFASGWWFFPHFHARIQAFLQVLPGMPGPLPYHMACLDRCVHSGGFSGKLFSGQVGRLHSLPYRYSDSVFAAGAEQAGLLGTLPMILLAVLWMLYCLRLARRTNHRGKSLFYTGAGAMITVQAFIHFAVNLGLMPVTGITLPFISYGGSSLLASSVILSMVFRCRSEQDHPGGSSAPPDILGD